MHPAVPVDWRISYRLPVHGGLSNARERNDE
jgi:hypothetical protein